MQPLRRPGPCFALPGLLIGVCWAGSGTVVQAAPSSPATAATAPRQALFRTRAEAEAAASQFHCSGAHRMGQLWMPCAGHGQASGSHQNH
ncbi:MAG: hypothetical protein VKI83_05650 [Synechococcaceae cyanobacterium]|nr:hypothetical protein [Synechococcaceae cyanobacterium]